MESLAIYGDWYGDWRKPYDRKQILASYTIPPRERN